MFLFIDVVEHTALFSRNNYKYTKLTKHKLHIYVCTHNNLHTVIQSKHNIELIYSSLLTALSAMTIKASDTLEHQPTVWSVPNTCAQPYHPGSGSHGQLFRPSWASSAWHSRRAKIGLYRQIRLIYLPSTCRRRTAVQFPATSSHMCCAELALKRVLSTRFGSNGQST